MGVEYSGGAVNYRCRSGHNLNYSYDTFGYESGYYYCDNCKTSNHCGSGRYNCSYCKWDICNNCANYYKPKSNPVSHCRSGHQLTYTTLCYPGAFGPGDYACDLCKRKYPSTQQRWCCTLCSYDICGFCRLPPGAMPGPMPGPMPNPMPAPMPGPIYRPFTRPSPAPMPGPIYNPNPNPNPYPYPYPSPQPQPMDTSKCPGGHILMLTNDDTGYYNGMYSCNKCHNSFYCGANQRYACTYCKYDICQGCKSY